MYHYQGSSHVVDNHWMVWRLILVVSTACIILEGHFMGDFGWNLSRKKVMGAGERIQVKNGWSYALK